MPEASPYEQLLGLISVRGQQWLRKRIDALPAISQSQRADIFDLADIAIAAHICSGLRGSEVPLEVFVKEKLKSENMDIFLSKYQRGHIKNSWDTVEFFRFLPDALFPSTCHPATASLLDRLAQAGTVRPGLLSEAEALLRRPVAGESVTEAVVQEFAQVLTLCYRFGADRPKFSSPRTYGEAFATCLQFVDWSRRNGRLVSLVQMIYCLCLIDPDHDVEPMLSDIISSQRPDGSFPERIGFGTGDQDDVALRPTLAAVVALHMAVHRRWRKPPTPTLLVAA